MAEQNAQTASQETPKEEYQTYLSSLQSHKLIRTDGKVLHVVGYKYITKDPEDIKYLDEEIAKGLIYIRKGDKVASSAADPMAALRKKIEEEAVAKYVEEQKTLAKQAAESGKVDISTTVPKPKDSESSAGKGTVKPASSAKLAGLAAGSNSTSSK